jgi:hypothetical protein
MEYLLSLTDADREHLVVFTLREIDVKRTAADFFFDVVGSDASELARDDVIAEGQAEDLRSLQQMIFDRDTEGPFIRDELIIHANGRQLDPDSQMSASFTLAERDSKKYMRCDCTISSFDKEKATAYSSGTAAVDDGQNTADEDAEKLQTFARMMFIHQIAIGFQIDVTKDLPEFTDSISEAEKYGWIEIDVQKASYKLTQEGAKLYDAWIAEAQDLIKRYDIYGDVDINSDGTITFDTKLGRDLRIPVMECDGVDPFRARYLIGLNDGDWDTIKDWFMDYKTQGWYEVLLRDIETAPTVDEIGRDTIRRVLDKGKEQLRMDSRFR